MKCIDDEGYKPLLNYGWIYKVERLPCRALRVFLDDGTYVICHAGRFRNV